MRARVAALLAVGLLALARPLPGAAEEPGQRTVTFFTDPPDAAVLRKVP